MFSKYSTKTNLIRANPRSAFVYYSVIYPILMVIRGKVSYIIILRYISWNLGPKLLIHVLFLYDCLALVLISSYFTTTLKQIHSCYRQKGDYLFGRKTFLLIFCSGCHNSHGIKDHSPYFLTWLSVCYLITSSLFHRLSIVNWNHIHSLHYYWKVYVALLTAKMVK